MWLRRLVGVTMIVSLIGMNAIAILGLFSSDKKPQLATTSQSIDQAPTVKLTVTPGNISPNSTATLSWSTTGSPTSCNAAGGWSGVKTPFGAESTGRMKLTGNFKFVLTCKNSSGTANAEVTLKVTQDLVTNQQPASSSGSSSGRGGSTYCGGRVPCYNASDVAAHSGTGNCWGWLGDRVINVSALDTGFHVARSGVSSIEVGGVCGKDLSPAVYGSVPAGSYTSGHPHELGAKSPSDKNYLSYFVGYFDANKK